MADTNQNDPTKFNMNSLMRFDNKERDKTLTIGAYNGHIQFLMNQGQFEKGVPPRAVTVTPHMAFLLKNLMENIINAPEPGKKKTLIFNGIWNNETKKRELSFTCTIGMDDSALCYIGVKHVNRNKEVFSGRFELSGDRYLEVSGDYDDDKSRSFTTLKMLHHLFDRCVFHTGSMLTRNHLIQPNFNRNRQQTHSSSAPSGSESLDDDF